ncbi:MAG: hypothetical protein WCJ66_07710, partial [Verrucomicrobiota bacterium]
VWGRHMGILSNDDLTKLKSQPGHELVSDPSSPLRGRLMSWAAVLKEHPERFSLQQPGEYNGSEGINRSVFGGSNTPDQIAKEMFDAGLIRHNTPDAMWDLLRQEQNMVAKMKAYLVTAKDELREARQQARAETNDWLATQTANQKENYSPKKEILQALASMDAIMTALPPDIRGKLGGYTQMARLGSDEVRLEYLKDKLARADELLEKYLRGNYDSEFKDLLKRARPNKDSPGERPTGRITPEVHDMFLEMEKAMSMNARDVEAEAAKQEALADHEDTTAAEAAKYTMTANLIRLAGNWLQASAARREQAFLEADRMFGEGFLAQKILYSKRAERQAQSREQLINEANRNGTTGTLPERKDEEAKKQGIGGWAKNLFYGLFSFEHLLHHCFGETSPEAIRLADAEREAANRKSDALFAANEALDHLFTSLGGGAMGGEKLRYKLGAESSIKIKLHSGEELSLTPFEAISATLMWRQEDGRRHMEGHLDDSGKPVGDWHYSQANMDSIEDQLPLAAKAVRLHLVEQYAAEYDRINAVYRGLYGMNLPRHADYSPLTVNPQKISGGTEPDPESGFAGSNGGITPGSLKTRSTSAIAEPDFRDALKTYIGHTRQMEHFIAYAGFSSEAKALLSRRDVGNPIKAAAGKQAFDVLRGWVDFFAQGGTRDAQNFLTLNQTLSKNMNRAASIALTGRVSVLAIQWLNLGSALAEMPTGSYLKRLALLTTGNLGWKDAFNSEYIQRRLQELPPVVRHAMEGLHSSKPNELTHAMARIGQLIGGADAMFTAGTYAMVHDYQTKQAKETGLTGAEAAEYIRTTTERICDRISQPTRAGARSLFEATSTNPGMKLLWAFSSEPRQKMGYLAWQLMNKDASAGRKARAAAVTFLIGGALQGLTRSFLADIKDSKDSKDAEWFDEKHWSAKRLALATFTSPFQGIPLLGDIIQQAAYSGFHEYSPEGNLLSGMVNAGKRVAHVPEWFTGQRDIEEGIKDAEAILAGIGAYNDTIAASASVAHLARDIYGTAKNVTK